MYNEYQKMRYIKDCKYKESTKETIRMLFNSTEMEENHFDKDLILFNRLEVIDLLRSFNSMSPNRLQSVCIYLADYYKWCYKEGLADDIQNLYEWRMVKTIIQEIIPIENLEKKYFTKQVLLEYLDSVKDVSNKFILYAIYLGINGRLAEDLVNIKIEDLNEERKELTLLSGRKVKVDDLFIKLMKETNEQETYFAEGVVKESQLKRFDYKESKYVLKKTGGKTELPIKGQIISNRLETIREQVGNEFLTIPVIYKNGMINYIKEKFAEDGINLKTGLYSMSNGKLFAYAEETQSYIFKYGAVMTDRALRRELKDYIDLL